MFRQTIAVTLEIITVGWGLQEGIKEELLDSER